MKIWFDKDNTDFNNFCSEQFLLLPFFSEHVLQKDNDFKNSQKWKASIEQHITYTTKEKCDVFLFPEKLNHKIGNYIFEARKYNKKILAFYNDDNDKPSNLDSSVALFRTSLFKSKQKNNEYAMPAWSQDFNDIVSFKCREKKEKPVVSFCGFFSNPIRKNCIETLKNNNQIQTNFIIRKNFWGGSPHNQQVRTEYVKNMINSDFVLCARGAGNFSYRFYEALSCGRIPIFVNTDCVLPCENKINWRDVCMFVEQPENINKVIHTYWNNLTNEKYQKMQNTIREIYLNYISPDGFTKYLNSLYG